MDRTTRANHERLATERMLTYSKHKFTNVSDDGMNLLWRIYYHLWNDSIQWFVTDPRMDDAAQSTWTRAHLQAKEELFMMFGTVKQ